MRTGYIRKLDSGEYSLVSRGEVIVKSNTASELVDIGKRLGLSPLKVYETGQYIYDDEILAGGDNLRECFRSEEVRIAWYDFMSSLSSDDPPGFKLIDAMTFKDSLTVEMKNVLSQGS